MNEYDASPDRLRQCAIETVAAYKERIAGGETDMAEVSDAVQAYCEAVAALPQEEGKRHMQGLEALMADVTALRDALVAVQEGVRAKLNTLPDVRRAHVAYQISDAIAGAKPVREEPES